MSESPSPQPVVPVLGYATFDADGLPDWVTDAEAAIDARARPTNIRRYFANADQAGKYFAKSMRRRCAINRLGDTCVVCGNTCTTAARIDWLIDMPLKAMEFKLSNKTPQYRFSTHHTMCRACSQQWIRSIRRIVLVSQIVRWGKATFLVLMFLTIFASRHMSILGSSWIGVVWVVDFLAIWPLAWVVRRWLQRCVPIRLREILPPKIRFVSLQAFDERAQMMSAAGESHG
jgi:hypothetical protein